jgi:hypothetical protein
MLYCKLHTTQLRKTLTMAQVLGLGLAQLFDDDDLFARFQDLLHNPEGPAKNVSSAVIN